MSIEILTLGDGYLANASDMREYDTKRVTPLGLKLDALIATGLAGAGIEFKVGKYPDLPDTPDDPDHQAILWREGAPEGEPNPHEWKLFCFKKEVKGEPGNPGAEGPIGPQGEQGPAGTGLRLRGSVANKEVLFAMTAGSLGMGYITTDTGHLWVTTGKQPDGVHWVWFDGGPFSGVKGDPGPQGPQGKQGAPGKKGDSGGVSSFLLNWIVGTATNQALAQAQIQMNNGFMEIQNQLLNLAEDAAESAVGKAIEDAWDELKGDKGKDGVSVTDTRINGDGHLKVTLSNGKIINAGVAKGADGRSCQIVGTYSTLALFQSQYPAESRNVGKAALIDKVGSTGGRELWAITESKIGVVQYEDLGDIRGPKGEDANWTIRLRDKDNAPIEPLLTIEPTAKDVPNFFIQGTSGVKVSPFQGTSSGFTAELEHPIPVIDTTSKDKILSNNGAALVWVDNVPEEGNTILTSPNGTKYVLGVTDDGRLTTTLVTEA